MMASETLLYGSHMSAVLPPGASDVSAVRQVPDNQEVYTHSATDQSIIIEILEYVDESDQEAILTHFKVLAEENGVSVADSDIIQAEQIDKNQIAMSECLSAWYVLGQQKVSKYHEDAKNTINIHMGLLRLPQFTTDILITFNDPLIIHPDSSSHQAIPVSCEHWTVDHFKHVVTSLKLLDANLFGEQ